jgi:AAA+ superfamily predicted ATPase
LTAPACSNILRYKENVSRAHARDAQEVISYQTSNGVEERERDPMGTIVPEGTAVDDPTAAAAPAAYATAWEHLSEELRRLHLLICCRLPEQTNGTAATPAQQFKGLVLTEEEIRALLGNPLDRSSYGEDQDIEDSANPDLQAALSRISSQIQARLTASLRTGTYLPFKYLAKLFHLTAFEEQCLLICLAPELDRKYEKLYAYLQDDVTRKKPSVDLVLQLLCQTMREKLAARLAFDPWSPLLKFRLLQMTDCTPDGPSTLLSRFLKLDDRVTNFLLGFPQIDARLVSFSQLLVECAQLDQVPVSGQLQSRIRSFIDWYNGRAESKREQIVFHFVGPYGSGKRLLAEAICHELKLPLLIAEAEKLAGGKVPFDEALWFLGREAALQSAALCIQDFDSVLADANHTSLLKSVLEVSKTFTLTLFLLGGRSWKPPVLLSDHTFVELEIPIPDDRTRERLWGSHLAGQSPLTTRHEAGALASKFRFTPGQIQNAAVTARNLARWRSPDDGELTEEDLYAACRAQLDPKLNRLARKIQPLHTWSDIVLPPDPLAQLRELCQRVDLSYRVLGEWGFGAKLSTGKGVNALFTGPSGTGKTMAAEILANELGLELYKIDLSQVVSKYIGETEKNLDSIFSAAEKGNVILFFDEADSLFGKRSEVRDSHDRYANIEISYLLQKMEDYEGVAILATNLSQNLDEAFVRRLAFSIQFPFPDEADRRRIWLGIWPPGISLAEDVDLELLARQFKLSGGNIKNVALAAAFFAAGDAGIVHMSHLLQATRREFQKLGKLFPGFDQGDISPALHSQ